MLKCVWATLLCCLATLPLGAQTAAPTDSAPPAPAPPVIPDTDIFVVDIDIAAQRAGTPRNITERAGYDNQPAFLRAGDALLYVVRDDSGSTDVWRVDLRSGKKAQVTHTPEAEYSPTPLPDGSGFSAVRVEAPHAEGEVFTESQRLFKYGFDGKPIGPVLAGIRRVGYHAWIDPTHVALFIVGNDAAKVPNSLVLADTRNGRTTPLGRDIGRSLGRSPQGRVTFVDQADTTAWNVVTIAPGDSAATRLAAVPPGAADEKIADRSQDFRWLPDQSLLMANGNRLLRWRGGAADRWETLAEFPTLPGRIRRLAVSPDGKRVAFVVDMPPQPAPTSR